MLTVSSTPFSGWRGRWRRSRAMKPCQASRSTVLVGILRGVSPGGVDQHGVIGEPPVAVARAADALELMGAKLFGEREAQAGVNQRGGLAGARRTDEHVPGQFVEVARGAQREEAGQSAFLRSGSGLALLEHAHGLLEALMQDGRFAGRLGVTRHAGRFGALRQTFQQLGVIAFCAPAPPDKAAEEEQHDRGDQDEAHPFVFKRCIAGKGKQRQDEPDHGQQCEDAEGDEEDFEKDFIAGSPDQLAPAAGKTMISTRRLSARCSGVSLGTTGSLSAAPSARIFWRLPSWVARALATASARACDKW